MLSIPPKPKSLNSLPETAPQKGDRFPWLRLKLAPNGHAEDLFQKLNDMEFNLVLFGQPPVSDATLGLGDLFRACTIASDPENDEELARVQIPQPSFFLVRPDGYIGLCGGRFEAGSFRAYVSENLHLSS
jgi:hypothetical protein